jgi:hypothetical protein
MTKSLILSAVALSLATSAVAQTPLATVLSGKGGGASAGGAAVNNPWVGAQVVHRFTDEAGFADNIVVSGRALYNMTLDSAGRWNLPFMGTVGDLGSSMDSLASKFDQLLLSNEGATVGAFPYFIAHQRNRPNGAADVVVTFHGVAALRANRFRPSSAATTDTATVTVTQMRVSPVGVELALGDQSDGKPTFTLSVAPMFTWFLDGKAYKKAFAEDAKLLRAAEITTIIPLGRGFGFLAEAVVTGGSRNAIRAGFIAAAESK